MTKSPKFKESFFTQVLLKIKPNISFKESAFGWDGLTTFIFSNVIFFATFGIFFIALFLRTLKMANETKNSIDPSRFTSKRILIAGLRLENNQPTDEFKIRLERVVSLFNRLPEVQIIILGGLTGDNAISEAQAGADYLIKQGVVAKQITIEDQSRHTLENLQNARTLLLTQLPNQSVVSKENDAVIISSRYHLYRIITLAQGLSMTLQPIAAEDNFELSFLNLLRLIKEAYYLHWYWSGKIWVFITINKKSKARIS